MKHIACCYVSRYRLFKCVHGTVIELPGLFHLLKVVGVLAYSSLVSCWPHSLLCPIGTYNNQYMVVDYKKYAAGTPLKKGTSCVINLISLVTLITLITLILNSKIHNIPNNPNTPDDLHQRARCKNAGSAVLLGNRLVERNG